MKLQPEQETGQGKMQNDQGIKKKGIIQGHAL